MGLAAPLMPVDLFQHRRWHHGPWLRSLLGKAHICGDVAIALARPFQFLVLYQARH